MAIIIPFPNRQNNQSTEGGEEVQILSDKHKEVLETKLRNQIKSVSTKDITTVHSLAFDKIAKIRSHKPFVNKMLERIKLLYEILFDDSVELSKVSRKTITAGLLYFAAPKDFLPDDIPGLGYLDDAYIITLVWEKVGPEIQNYLSLKGWDERKYL